ncbi:exodeoxyribonuclease VII large subunit [Desulfurispira natronophila]|uniref:Exodeoxyribonuclease 7 large subunit n=1 Tax=Desulfurispira natronophila TaxID=682562 RepID=A0A7W7Y3W6_9BACT|nr:exodeoxyribonuclease VII large subunit [Desulfurispira natronophila]MBB5021605.1 exodeoxyribonuclease VII large subunit [Desulfurispira natronophila]
MPIASTAEDRYYTVSTLLTSVRFHLKRGFRQVRVRGEVFSCTTSAAGHQYLSLREGEESLKVVLFRTYRRQKQDFSPGDMVECQGSVDIYSSTFQVIATRVQPLGDGELFEAFLQLKTELEKKGYFDRLRKKPIPPYPRKVAIITSSSGAALQDILSTASDVLYCLHLEIHHVNVQGTNASGQIAAALQSLQPDSCDLAVVCRGGGSALDLQAFNTREVADGVFHCLVPVISAVGHETDLTICDLVADLRVETPTAFGHRLAEPWRQAAERTARLEQQLGRTLSLRLEREKTRLQHMQQRFSFGVQGLCNRWELRLDRQSNRLNQAMQRLFNEARQRAEKLQHRLERSHPARHLHTFEQRVLYLQHQLEQGTHRLLQKREYQLHAMAIQLKGASPRTILQRGYAILRQEDGTVVADTRNVRKGQNLKAMLRDGSLSLTINSKEEEKSE